jgi:pimeloyl-ACP methyl ester carboxylesterase/DNA-binding CsgD family transcriptional regulator
MKTETRYANSGGVKIGYQVVGEGPLDLVLVHGFVSHLEVAWEHPWLAQFLNRLASFSRLIVFDKRGTGLSDPIAEPPTLNERMDDIRAVMDAAQSERAAVFGYSEGGPLSISFSCASPERTSALIVYGSYARWLRADSYPWGRSPAQFRDFLAGIDLAWETGEWWGRHNPSVVANERYQHWWARYMRMSASPGMASALVRMNSQIDVRDLLPKVRVPTLVLHRTNELWLEVGNGRYLADKIPGAKLVELPGVDHVPWVGEAESILREVELFLLGPRRRRRGRADGVGTAALTRREREVALLAIEGEPAAAIAKRLFISERTVESHLAGAYAKLGVQSRVELARHADDF